MPLTKGEFSQDATEYRPQPEVQSRPSGVSSAVYSLPGGTPTNVQSRPSGVQPTIYSPPVGAPTTVYKNTSGMYKTTSSSDSYNTNNMLEDELQYGRKVRIIIAQNKK
jgi:hypothetical protein